MSGPRPLCSELVCACHFVFRLSAGTGHGGLARSVPIGRLQNDTFTGLVTDTAQVLYSSGRPSRSFVRFCIGSRTCLRLVASLSSSPGATLSISPSPASPSKSTGRMQYRSSQDDHPPVIENTMSAETQNKIHGDGIKACKTAIAHDATHQLAAGSINETTHRIMMSILDLISPGNSKTKPYNEPPPTAIQSTQGAMYTSLGDQSLMPGGELPVELRSFHEDPFSDNAFPTEPTPPVFMSRVTGPKKGTGKEGKNKKKTKNLDNVKNVDKAETWPKSSCELPLGEVAIIPLESARLELPCLKCFRLWTFRFESTQIPAQVLPGNYEKAMGLTICPTGCGVISGFTLTPIHNGPYRCNTMPFNAIVGKHIRGLLHIDAPVVNWDNEVLFFQPSQVADLAKLGGTLSSRAPNVRSSNM